MNFPIMTPKFFLDVVDLTKPASEYADYAEIVVSPSAVEYIAHLSNPAVVKRLMEIEGPIEYQMSKLPEDKSEAFIAQSQRFIAGNPNAAYYWQLRTLMMSILQNKSVLFEKRILLLNYGIKTIQSMIDNHQPNLIPQFVAEFTKLDDYEKILEYFKSISPNFGYSLADGISLIKSVAKTSPEYKSVVKRIYKNLGVSGPETLNMTDMKKYIEMRRDFSEKFMAEHSTWVENIMVNYVWTYSIPYAESNRINLWENYVFFCALYNAIKILITCYKPVDEEEFIKLISSFDDALRQSGKSITWRVVAAMKNAGQANNGDMAILTIS